MPPPEPARDGAGGCETLASLDPTGLLSDDAAPAEVCRLLAISSGNLWVLLHRARLRLVNCLQVNGLDSEGESCGAAGTPPLATGSTPET